MIRRRLDDRFDLYYPATEAETADLLQSAIERSVTIVHDAWGLKPPHRCRIVIMTSWLSYCFHAAPWYAWIPYALSLPLWAFRLRKLWRFCAGCTLSFWSRPVVGVKPPRLIAYADKSIGRMLFIEEPDPRKKLEHALCHELTHAFTAHLRLPPWLNEGVAMLAVDRYFGRPTVRGDSLDLLASGSSGDLTMQYRQLTRLKHQDIARHYARGYWITRLLQENHPDLLRDLLSRRRSRRCIEKRIAGVLDLRGGKLWQAIDGILAARFSAPSQA